MKKILTVLIMILFVVGCTKKDEFSRGSYNGRSYTNNDFGINVSILEGYSFLTSEELLKINEESHSKSKDPESAKYFNKVMEVVNTEGVTLVMYVDSTPDVYKNSDAEANAYLDFLTEQRVAYKLNKEDVELGGLDYKKLDLEFDFDQRQYSLYAVSEGKLVNIQVTYPKGEQEAADTLLEMFE